jgi:hypothetical protein
MIFKPAQGNSSEQLCQPSENTVHPSSFTQINPTLILGGILKDDNSQRRRKIGG